MSSGQKPVQDGAVIWTYKCVEINPQNQSSLEIYYRNLLQNERATETSRNNSAVLNIYMPTLECVCGHETSPTHYVQCLQHATQLRKLRKSFSIEIISVNLLDLSAFESFLNLRTKQVASNDCRRTGSLLGARTGIISYSRSKRRLSGVSMRIAKSTQNSFICNFFFNSFSFVHLFLSFPCLNM